MTDHRYLPNIRNPRVIETAFRLLQERPLTEDEIATVTGLEGSLLEETLDGLLAYGLAQKREFEYVAQSLAFDIDQEHDLRLTMLRNLRQRSTDGDWDQQAAIYLTYAFFLEQDIQYFKHSDEALATQIDEYHQEVGLRSEAEGWGPAEFKKNKFNNWAKHAKLLGLTHKARGSEFTIAPDPSLVFATVELAASAEGAEEGTVYVEDYIQWLNNQLLVVPFSEHRVPKSLGRVLYSLARDDAIELVRIGDPQTVSMNYLPREHPNVNRRINAIKVTADGY